MVYKITTSFWDELVFGNILIIRIFLSKNYHVMASDQMIFVSYARVDSDFALKISTELKDAGANLWLDKLDIEAGAVWDVEIEKALVSCDCMLFIASKASSLSNNVLNEVFYAVDEQKRIIPVKIDDCQIPFRIRRLQYIDLSSNYDAGFKQLLKTLNIKVQPETALPNAGKKEELPIDEELRAWEKVRDTKFGYVLYLKNYPEGKFVKEARESIEELLWTKSRQGNSVESFTKYLNNTELGVHTKEAKEAISDILKKAEQKEKEDNERSFCEKTQQENTISGYQKYLQAYPNGIYLNEANKKMIEKRQSLPSYRQNIEVKYQLSASQKTWVVILGVLIVVVIISCIILIKRKESDMYGAHTIADSISSPGSNRNVVIGYLGSVSEPIIKASIKLVSSDLTLHDKQFVIAGNNIESLKSDVSIKTPCPDFKIENVYTVASGDSVEVREKWSGTFARDLAELKATGKSFYCDIDEIFKFDNYGNIIGINLPHSEDKGMCINEIFRK